MKTTKNISLVVVFMIGMTTYAQQVRQTNSYVKNKYSLNPAYAGESGCTEFNFSHLNQWVNIAGAPVTNFFSGNTRIGKSLGVGANVMLDRTGMFQQLSASGTVAYGLTFAKDHKVRLGISGGYFQLRINPEDAIAFDVGDNIVEGGIQSSNSANTEAGILYSFKGLELSFASQQLIEMRSSFNYPSLDGYGLRRHYLGMAKYSVVASKTLTVTPSLVYRGVNNINQLDINCDLNYDDFIYGGLGYRTGVGLIGRIGVQVKRLFYIGYAYEVPMQNIASYGAGSHEIALALTLCKKPKDEIVEDIAEEPIRDTITITETSVETVVDTIRIVERITDTLVVNRVDTVYIEKVERSNKEIERAIELVTDHLEFEYDKSLIKSSSYPMLESLTNLLLVRTDVKLLLEGHTDDRGTAEYNLKLSRSRVKAIRDYLISNGVDPSRVKAEAYGESRPIANNNTAEGRAKNRRVDFKIVD